MTGLPERASDVDTSATLLQLDMASAARRAVCRPTCARPSRLSVNRQALVNQQVSWAVPGVDARDSHVTCRGSRGTSRHPPRSPTTTRPGADVVDLDDHDRGGRQRELPSDPGAGPGGRVPDGVGAGQAAPGSRYYHYAFGVPFTLHLAVDASDPWAAAAAPTISPSSRRAGFDTT